LVRNGQPKGIGLVPIYEQDVRLNADSPVYVDWKSPPYVGADLVEWWRRIDTVRRFTKSPESICQSPDFSSFEWAVVKLKTTLPSCMQNWPIQSESQNLKLIIRQN